MVFIKITMKLNLKDPEIDSFYRIRIKNCLINSIKAINAEHKKNKKL